MGKQHNQCDTVPLGGCRWRELRAVQTPAQFNTESNTSILTPLRPHPCRRYRHRHGVSEYAWRSSLILRHQLRLLPLAPSRSSGARLVTLQFAAMKLSQIGILSEDGLSDLKPGTPLVQNSSEMSRNGTAPKKRRLIGLSVCGGSRALENPHKIHLLTTPKTGASHHEIVHVRNV